MNDDLIDVLRDGRAHLPHAHERPPLVRKPAQIEPWRIFKIMSEFVEGFDLISRYGKAASFFGSARASFDAPVYQHATELAERLSKSGFAIITGGSDGVMQAANKGAYNAGGASIGLNIRLPNGQKENQYLTDSYEFDHFFVRKVMLTFASEAYVYFPGGFGTLDEFFEILTLVQTKKIHAVPIVLVGKAYWTPLADYFRTVLCEEHKAVDPADLELYHIVDTVDEAYEYIIANAAK